VQTLLSQASNHARNSLSPLLLLFSKKGLSKGFETLHGLLTQKIIRIPLKILSGNPPPPPFPCNMHILGGQDACTEKFLFTERRVLHAQPSVISCTAKCHILSRTHLSWLLFPRRVYHIVSYCIVSTFGKWKTTSIFSCDKQLKKGFCRLCVRPSVRP
jgi:hypothetical protein